MKSVFFRGELTTLSPITVVGPNAPEIVNADGGKRRRVVHRTITVDGVRISTPVVPGSTLRGRIRRSACEVVRLATGQPSSLREFHQNAVGGVKGSESEDAYDIIYRQMIRAQNPILGLFGAGSPWMMSHAMIEDAVPRDPCTPDVVNGVRADDGRRDPTFFDKLTADARDLWKAAINANAARTDFKARDKSLKADLRKARLAGDADGVKAAEQAITALRQEMEAADGASENPVSMPLQHEAIPAGVTLRHEMRLISVTEEEIGLFLAAINHMSAVNPAIGQHANLGYGLLSGTYDVEIRDDVSFDPFVVGTQTGPRETGTLTIAPFEGVTNLSENLTAMIAQFKEALERGAFDFRLAAEVRAA